MQKIKLLLAMFFFISFIQNVNAQFGGSSKVNNLTIVWDGDGGYRTNTAFTIKMQVGSQWITHTFNGPGTFIVPNYLAGTIIGTIEGSINTAGFGFITSYTDFTSNYMIIGEEYPTWLGTWNSKNWYWYNRKMSITEWHFRIGN